MGIPLQLGKRLKICKVCLKAWPAANDAHPCCIGGHQPVEVMVTADPYPDDLTAEPHSPPITRNDVIEFAEQQGLLILRACAMIREQINEGASISRHCLVDGSHVSPSWRAMVGGEEVFQLSYGDVEIIDVYEELLENYIERAQTIHDLSIAWEEGCLWVEELRDDC